MQASSPTSLPTHRPVGGRLFKSLLVNLVAVGLTRSLSIILLPLVTRHLGDTQLSTYALITALQTLLISLAIFGLDAATGHFFWTVEDDVSRRSFVANWLVLSLEISLVLGVITTLLAWTLGLLSNAFGLAWVLLAVSIPVSMPQPVAQTMLRALGKLRVAATAGVLGTTLQIASTIAGLLLSDYSLNGLMVGFTLGIFANSCVNVIALGSWADLRSRRPEHRRPMLRVALPLVPAAVFVWFIALSDRYLVAWFRSDAEVSRYYVAATVASAAGLLTISFSQAWVPFAMSIHKTETSRPVYARSYQQYALITGVLTLLTGVLGGPIVRSLAGGPFAHLDVPLTLLVASSFVGGAFYFAAIGPAITGETIQLSAATISAALTNVGLNFLFIPLWGLGGAAVTTLVSVLVQVVVAFHLSTRSIHLGYRHRGAAMTWGAYLLLAILSAATPYGAIVSVRATCLVCGLAGATWLGLRQRGMRPAARQEG